MEDTATFLSAEFSHHRWSNGHLMNNYLKEIFNGLKSLVIGLKVTMTTMLTKSTTIEWPREAAPIPEKFRGHIMLRKDEETGLSKCIACGSCVRACPSNCIQVKGAKPEGAKKKAPILFQLDFTKCSLCGLCVESCPVDAITFSRDYALAGPSSEPFAAMNLLAGLASPFIEESNEL
jgi:NADH-quinone oxidoreductase subunit I